MKYNNATQCKLESLLQLVAYKIRYERGIFQSSYCILQNKNVVVINKFLTIEEKINALSDIICELEINIRKHYITEDLQKLLDQCTQQKIQAEAKV